MPPHHTDLVSLYLQQHAQNSLGYADVTSAEATLPAAYKEGNSSTVQDNRAVSVDNGTNGVALASSSTQHT